MVIGLLTLVLPLVTLLIMFAWGLFIGLKRTRVRFICVAASFVISMIVAFSVKNLLANTVMNLLNSSANAGGAEVISLIMNSEGMREALFQCGGALIAPWVFLIVFVLLCTISWIICNILFLFTSLGKKSNVEFEEAELEENIFSDLYGEYDEPVENVYEKKGLFRIAIYALAQVLLTFFVILTPVVSTLDCVPAVVNSACDMGLIQKESQDANAMTHSEIMDTLGEIDRAPLVVCYRALGGNALCNKLTSFEILGQKSNLHTELNFLSDFVSNIFKLSGKKIQDYGDADVEVLRKIDADVHNSIFLPVVAGDLIYAVTDGWLDESGSQAVLGMQKPSFDQDTTAMVAEPFDHILEAFHKDAHNIEALRADLDTVERTMEILIETGVIAGMRENHTNILVELLNSGTTIQQLLDEFDKNPSFAPLTDDITRIGMRAMGSTLKIPSESNEAYNQFTGDLASTLSDLNAQGMTAEEQKTYLTTTIRDTYEQQSGEKLELGDEVVELYADVLVKEFEGKQDISAEDMQKFFDAYAGIQTEDAAGTPAA